MIEIISIVFFLIIAGLGLVMLKVLKYYIGLCKIKELEKGEGSAKITDFFKKSIVFFVGVSLIFLVLFLISDLF